MLRTTLRKTAAVAAAATVASGALLAAAAPAQATTYYKIKLQVLWCEQTEDWSGGDEPFITVKDSRVWSGYLNNQQSADLNITTKAYSGTTRIKLYDADAGNWTDPHDFLGELSVDASDIGQGGQTGWFTQDGADYALHYEVVPA